LLFYACIIIVLVDIIWIIRDWYVRRKIGITRRVVVYIIENREDNWFSPNKVPCYYLIAGLISGILSILIDRLGLLSITAFVLHQLQHEICLETNFIDGKKERRIEGYFLRWVICTFNMVQERKIQYTYDLYIDAALGYWWWIEYVSLPFPEMLVESKVSHCDSRPSNKVVCSREQGTHSFLKETQCDTWYKYVYANINENTSSISV
jgi:hypothetical protein